ncbi:MAG: hypothetical protein GXP54_03880, partial [Deltaproteobacteria bacterium]|nr:hypothetical protein [Deltaproteobacteria bacterium]
MSSVDRSRAPRLAGMSIVSAVAVDLTGFNAAMQRGERGIRDEMEGWPVALIRDAFFRRDTDDDSLADMLNGVATAAFTDAGEDPALLREPTTALIISSTKGDIQGLATSEGETSLGPFAARIGRRLGVRGHLELVSCACASGGVALTRALRILRGGWARRVLVLGFERLNRFLVKGFGSLGALSRSPARPFDRNRDGLTLGEGAAAILLELDGRPGIRVTGAGQSCDATGMIRPAADGSGLILAMDRAIMEAGADRPVDAVCGHGTGTVANDAMEAAAFISRFDGRPPPVFGVKGATGHTMGCCGVTEAIVCALALTGGYIPGTTGFESGNEGLDVAAATRDADMNRLLSVNAGFGGINIALVIEKDLDG